MQVTSSRSLHHICQFTASSVVRFFCFITHSLPFTTFMAGLLCFIPFGNQFSIGLGHLLSSICSIFSYHFNMLFFIVPSIVCVTPILSLIISFLTFQYFGYSCSSSPKIHFCTCTAFSLIHNPLFGFHNWSLNCFPPLCKVFICI